MCCVYLCESAGEWHGRGEPLVPQPRYQRRPLRGSPRKTITLKYMTARKLYISNTELK